MSRPHLEMVCAICLIPLNTLGDTYIHPLGSRTGHPHQPDPVPVACLDTVRRTCDFCSDPYPIWTFTGGDLSAVITSAEGGLIQNYGDRWAACAACYQDIVRDRTDRLAERALRTLPALDPAAHTRVTELHQSFLSALQPGRTLITTTRWPTSPVTARELPKIRDRLIRLLRSPITLPAHLALDREHLADQIEQCRLYWVDPTFTELATTAAVSLPTTRLHPDLIPCAAAILAWATPVGDTAAITWTMHDTAIRLVRYRNIGNGLDGQLLQQVREDVGSIAPIGTHTLPPGSTIDPATNSDLATLLATWLLMGQPAAETPAAEIDKPTRRSYTRAHRPLPDVRLVRLHTARHNGPGTPRRETPDDRNTRTERVWVTGHWRNQPYGPGRSLRRPVYIHPFLRGPDDAPIKLSTTVRMLTEPTQKRPG